MFYSRFSIGLILAVALATLSHVRSDETTRDGDWVNTRDPESGDIISTMRLKVHPRAAPNPALKYRLIPDVFDRRDGNSAIYYLKAMGYLEQTNARNALQEYAQRAREQALREGSDISDFPPYSWLELPLEDLPVTAVKEYLNLTRFQPPLLAEAARQKQFSLDRHIREVEDPMAYLLPEIQAMRELARKQSLRCRVAIAEKQAHEAIHILAQQFAMANHLGSDEFLVSNLVGAAVSGIATTDALQLVQLEEAPNLYWAIAALPDPLIDMQEAYAFERQFLYEQVKVLREVDETPRSVGYWQDFIDRLILQLRETEMDGMIFPKVAGDASLRSDSLDRAEIVAFIAAAYPTAKRYLVDTSGMDREAIEKYPTAQVVFLAMVKFHRMVTDEFLKWNHVPIWRAINNKQYQALDSWLDAELKRLGWASAPVGYFLTAFKAARTAQYRVQQSLALLQTVEAIRLYAAENANQLPISLSHLAVPAPLDPFTGEALNYEYNRSNVVLTASRLPGIRYRLIIEIANQQ